MVQVMINNFLIISFIGKNDRLGLRINKDFFIYNFVENKKNNDTLVSEIDIFLKKHNAILDKDFSGLVNQGPGSFSGIRTALAVAKGLEISKKIRLYGFKSQDLRIFSEENIEKLIKKDLIEKNLIKPIYLS